MSFGALGNYETGDFVVAVDSGYIDEISPLDWGIEELVEFSSPNDISVDQMNGDEYNDIVVASATGSSFLGVLINPADTDDDWFY